MNSYKTGKSCHGISMSTIHKCHITTEKRSANHHTCFIFENSILKHTHALGQTKDMQYAIYTYRSQHNLVLTKQSRLVLNNTQSHTIPYS